MGLSGDPLAKYTADSLDANKSKAIAVVIVAVIEKAASLTDPNVAFIVAINKAIAALEAIKNAVVAAVSNPADPNVTSIAASITVDQKDIDEAEEAVSGGASPKFGMYHLDDYFPTFDESGLTVTPAYAYKRYGLASASAIADFNASLTAKGFSEAVGVTREKNIAAGVTADATFDANDRFEIGIQGDIAQSDALFDATFGTINIDMMLVELHKDYAGVALETRLAEYCATLNSSNFTCFKHSSYGGGDQSWHARSRNGLYHWDAFSNGAITWAYNIAGLDYPTEEFAIPASIPTELQGEWIDDDDNTLTVSGDTSFTSVCPTATWIGEYSITTVRIITGLNAAETACGSDIYKIVDIKTYNATPELLLISEYEMANSLDAAKNGAKKVTSAIFVRRK